jgi:hypothetical protein
MSLTAGSKLFRSRSEIFAFFSRPEAEIEDNVHPQFKGSAGNIPEHGLDEAVSDVVFWLSAS